MLREWSDRLPSREAAELWQKQVDLEVGRRMAVVERELRGTLSRCGAFPASFYDAMHHFLALRDKLFPDMSPDPAWKMLVELAWSEPESDKCSISGLAYGADVPLTTALRYIAVMEVQGIVERIPHPSDGRQVMIRLTKEGRRRLDEVGSRWQFSIFFLMGVPLAALVYLSCTQVI